MGFAHRLLLNVNRAFGPDEIDLVFYDILIVFYFSYIQYSYPRLSL